MRYKERMMKTRILRTLFILIIGLALAALIAFIQIKEEQKDLTTHIIQKDFGGAFTLLDQNENIFTHEDLAGSYSLIYFGFTYCPAICPTELQRMAQVLKSLPQNKAAQIKPVFITVDPERDDVATMRQYVEQFHPDMVGLTGTVAQIDQAKDAYKIYAAKVQDETMSDYTMDHSSFIYFIDPQQNLRRLFKADDSVEFMTDIINRTIQ